jgi:hypothetical protein
MSEVYDYTNKQLVETVPHNFGKWSLACVMSIPMEECQENYKQGRIGE